MMMKEQRETTNRVGIIANKRRTIKVIMAIFQRVGATHTRMRRTVYIVTKVVPWPALIVKLNPDGTLATGMRVELVRQWPAMGRHKACLSLAYFLKNQWLGSRLPGDM